MKLLWSLTIAIGATTVLSAPPGTPEADPHPDLSPLPKNPKPDANRPQIWTRVSREPQPALIDPETGQQFHPETEPERYSHEHPYHKMNWKKCEDCISSCLYCYTARSCLLRCSMILELACEAKDRKDKFHRLSSRKPDDCSAYNFPERVKKLSSQQKKTTRRFPSLRTEIRLKPMSVPEFIRNLKMSDVKMPPMSTFSIPPGSIVRPLARARMMMKVL
ncbi:MAG: serine/threonine protein kinase, AGC [Watsoniomyces obsoletus]|nr:MAG: serine/threonine protein kinase, AGC [Watsoniomyces obsoletus]